IPTAAAIRTRPATAAAAAASCAVPAAPIPTAAAMRTGRATAAAIAAFTGARAPIPTPAATPTVRATAAAAEGARPRELDDREAAAVAYCGEDQEIADRPRHADAGGARMGILPALGMHGALAPGPHDRRAAFGLDRDHARPLRTDQAERLQLGEAFPHADQPRAPARRVEDQVGKRPAELPSKLEAHRLLALDPIGLLQRRHVEPAARGRALGDQ